MSDDGYQNITVLDVSQIAIDLTKSRLGSAAGQVRWLVGDITEIELEPCAYDLWHDRAVFHFLTAREQRITYVRQVTRSVKPGGHIIVSTFGPEGPTKCSGLEVMRYDAVSLHGEFGARFRLIESSKELHHTPFGTTQQFLYCHCRIEQSLPTAFFSSLPAPSRLLAQHPNHAPKLACSSEWKDPVRGQDRSRSAIPRWET